MENQPKKGQQSADKRPPEPQMRDIRQIYALRLLLWTILLFVFLRGLAAIAFPADIERLYNELSQTITAVDNRTIPMQEAIAFAESFAMEFFTYKAGGGEDYKKRMGSYCNSRLISDMCDGISLRGSARAVYASAIEVVPYSDTQQDITVLVVTDYTTEQPTMVDGREELQQVMVAATAYLTVPVYLSPSGYLVEDMPMITAPPPIATDYELREFTGIACDDQTKQQVSIMLGDFFQTLYSEGQQRIDYYLTDDANKQHLREIQGTMRFSRVEAVSVYNGAIPGDYLAIVLLRLEDISGTPVKQRMNVSLSSSGSRLYVRDINLRSHNIK